MSWNQIRKEIGSAPVPVTTRPLACNKRSDPVVTRKSNGVFARRKAWAAASSAAKSWRSNWSDKSAN